MTGINANVAYIHHFTAHTIDTLRYNFSRSSTRATPYFANRLNVSQQVGVNGNNQDPQNWGPPALSMSSGISGLSDGQEALNRNQTSAVSNSLIWVRGTHNVTIGGDFRRQQFNLLSLPNARGGFGFNGGLTSQYVSVATWGRGSILPISCLGIRTLTLSPTVSRIDFRTSWFDAYVTDDWISAKVTSTPVAGTTPHR